MHGKATDVLGRVLILRRICKGKWTHSKVLNGLYCSPHIVRVIKSRIMRWTGHVARMGKRRVLYRVFLGKVEGKRQLGRSSCRWEDNIKMDYQQVGCEGMDWIELAQDKERWRALVSAVMKLQFS